MGVGLYRLKKKTPQLENNCWEIKRCADTDKAIVGVPIVVEVVEVQVPLVVVPVECGDLEVVVAEPKYAICHP